MTVEVGTPQWTLGHFKRETAQDDLGLESVGAGLLRRLVPGVVETTVSAAYYSFYPFLIQEFEHRAPDETKREAFKPFYRRQEAAFAFGCSLHEHRGRLRGLNGVDIAGERAREAIHAGEHVVDLRPLVEHYMQSTYGGYGLFYRGALEDLGLTKLGAGTSIDRLTPLGETVADKFRVVIEPTEYWQHWADSPEVPIAVLQALGAVVCPCCLPNRQDHEVTLDAFFGARLAPEWQSSRRSRVHSLRLFLDFHAQRPDGPAGVGEWRRALLGGVFSDGTPWRAAADDIREGWRAYQLRETEALALSCLWTAWLTELDGLGTASSSTIREAVVASVDWESFGGKATTLTKAMSKVQTALPDALALTERAEGCEKVLAVGVAATAALQVLLAIPAFAEGDDLFHLLLDEGGDARWSVQHLLSWLSARGEVSVSHVLGDLLDELYFQHVRVATGKISATDRRDPFCVRDDEGLLRVIRPDAPLWTGARFTTVNHLLWTLGLLTEPDGNPRPTERGTAELARAVSDG